jgi:hypothetical protein
LTPRGRTLRVSGVEVSPDLTRSRELSGGELAYTRPSTRSLLIPVKFQLFSSFECKLHIERSGIMRDGYDLVVPSSYFLEIRVKGVVEEGMNHFTATAEIHVYICFIFT